MSRLVQPADLRLMLVTDRGMAGGRSLEAIVRLAVTGGVSAVQLREKTAGTREFVELARGLAKELADLGVPLIINDRIDVALAAGVANVHIGQSDMRPVDVRRLMGPKATIGLSINAIADMRGEDLKAVDYLGVGPVFPTGSKADAAPALGLGGLEAIVGMTHLPVIAIGGVAAANVEAVRAVGVAGVAVVSAIMAAADPKVAAAELVSPSLH
jgi:thiamine-phosphate pyrophosphorylase